MRVFGVLGPAQAVAEMAAFVGILWLGGWHFGTAPDPVLLAAASGTAFTAVVLGQFANAFACRSEFRWIGKLRWRQPAPAGRARLRSRHAAALPRPAFRRRRARWRLSAAGRMVAGRTGDPRHGIGRRGAQGGAAPEVTNIPPGPGTPGRRLDKEGRWIPAVRNGLPSGRCSRASNIIGLNDLVIGHLLVHVT
ncbi:hypothetical protein [Nonomuraea solani]|uniref:hypothetical protein n=1 Tax=Nonomuraea solani TaxID=1144553 RepID=UPI0038990CCD